MYDSHTRRMRKPAGLLLVPMIDIFTVLVTFLLMTAVFARITILQLDLPSAADGKVTEPTFRLEVIVRKDGLELTNGTALIATIPISEWRVRPEDAVRSRGVAEARLPEDGQCFGAVRARRPV